MWLSSACLGLVNVKVRIRDAKEGMCGSDAHESYVVVLQDIFWVHISLVTPNKVVQLVVEHDAVCAPAHVAHNLRRMFVLLRLSALLPTSLLNGIAEEDVQNVVYDCNETTKCAHDPVKDAHVDFHELSLDEARIAVHY